MFIVCLYVRAPRRMSCMLSGLVSMFIFAIRNICFYRFGILLYAYICTQARVFVACKLFFYLREKTIFYLAINVRQFFFYVLSRKFFVVCFPYYVGYHFGVFFWSTYFSSISTTNFFFCPHFQQTTNFFF